MLEGSWQSLLSNFQVLQYRTARSQITFLSLTLLKVAQLQVNACKESVLGYVI